MTAHFRVLIFCALLAMVSNASAAVLVKDATVVGILNDFWGGNLLVVALTPPASPTYPCGISGNNGGVDGVWMWDYDNLSGIDQRNADKIYILFNMAWLTEMTVAVESVDSSENCADAAYITIQNPAYP